MVNLTNWEALLLVGALMLLVAELGYRSGRRLDGERRTISSGQTGPVQAAVLGLLGLLLGFTFSMAVTRYDLRRQLVVQEANDIRTTYLRASLLPDKRQVPVEKALRRYLDVRIKARELAADPNQFAAGIRESRRIQAELWTQATAASREIPLPVMTTFVQALNDMFDADTRRIAAGRAHIPGGVWLLLLFMASCGCAITGYRAGLDRMRTVLSSWFLPLTITLVIILIYDVASPLQGLIGVGQQPLLDLQTWMAGG